ncbi:unnamed protein product [Caenorhabditis nigoni]
MNKSRAKAANDDSTEKKKKGKVSSASKENSKVNKPKSQQDDTFDAKILSMIGSKILRTLQLRLHGFNCSTSTSCFQ